MALWYFYKEKLYYMEGLMMKKVTIIVFMALFCSIVHSVAAQSRLFLENHYGAPIKCRVFNNNTTKRDRLMSNKDTVINNQERVLLGVIPHAKNVGQRFEYVTDIVIATTRYLSSGYTSLNGYLEAMSNAINSCCAGMGVPLQYRQFCNENKLCNKDAIIVVYPSSAISGWNIDVQWRDAGRTVIGQ